MAKKKIAKKETVAVEPEKLQEIEVTARITGEVTLTTKAENLVQGVINARSLVFSDFFTLKPKVDYNFFEKPEVRGVWLVDND